jgi:hypothetical protein
VSSSKQYQPRNPDVYSRDSLVRKRARVCRIEASLFTAGEAFHGPCFGRNAIWARKERNISFSAVMGMNDASRRSRPNTKSNHIIWHTPGFLIECRSLLTWGHDRRITPSGGNVGLVRFRFMGFPCGESIIDAGWADAHVTPVRYPMYVKSREVGKDMVLLCCWPVGYAQTAIVFGIFQPDSNLEAI